MLEQPHYTNLLTKEFFEEYYVNKKMSYPKIRTMLLEKGHNIAVCVLYKYAKKFGIGRNASEAKRNWDPYAVDYDKSFLTEPMIEAIDGFLLGDGCIHKSNSSSLTGRLGCGVQYKEFAELEIIRE